MPRQCVNPTAHIAPTLWKGGKPQNTNFNGEAKKEIFKKISYVASEIFEL